jgi:hypothetical protein
MTTTIVFSDAADGGIYTVSSSYANALAGTGTQAVTSTDTITFGQGFNTAAFPGSQYSIDQAFISFTFSAPAATEKVVASYIRAYENFSYNSSVSRILDWAEFDWGASLTTADFRPQSAWAGLTSYGRVSAVQNWGGYYVFGGTDTLNTRIASGGPLRLVGASDRARVGATPTVDERTDLASADASGTSSDPALVYTTITISTLQGVMNAQVQLTDGTHAFLEYDAAGTGSLTLKYHNGTSASTIGTVGVGTSGTLIQSTWAGAQAVTLVRDDSNNLYIIGKLAASNDSICVETWTKGSGATWTVGTRRSAALTTYTEGSLNNFAAAWHNVGTSGTIMLVASHSAGRAPQDTADILYALLNCQYLLTGTGSLLRNQGSANGTLVMATSGFGIANPTGTMLDVAAAPGTTDRGYVFSTSGNQLMGDNSASNEVWRYKLASDGTSIADTDDGTEQWAVKDASSKLRVIGLDSTVFASLSNDNDTGYGPTVYVQQNFGTSSSFTELGYVTLDGDVTSLPSSTVMSTSPLWDLAYDSTGKKLWLYYFDKANNRRLMRTSVDMNTYLADNNEVQVNSAVGASGSTNLALRVHRGALAGQTVLVSVANRTSGGVHSTQYIVDTFNVAPTAPTLSPKTNFDATASATFSWTFNDPNAGDTQSAYQLQINSSSGVYRYDSAKVTASAATYIGAGASAVSASGSLSPAVPSGLAGDTLVILASVRNSGTGTVNTPTGYQVLGSSGNVSVFGKVADTDSESATTVSFTGGTATDDVMARVFRFRNLPLFTIASNVQLNGSAQNITYPALTVPLANSVVLVAGWKQDDWTSVASLAGFTEVEDSFSTGGNDAGQVMDYVIQTTATNITSSSFNVTGGASAISRGLVLSLGPAGLTATSQSHVLPANVLTNGNSWQWRVRTYDAAGLVSPWSDFGTFSTASGGTVTITDPATDNPAGVVTNSYDIDWMVTGTTQASYRVQVTQVSNGSTLIDTGYVSSSATTNYLVSGMLSDVQYQIAVTVKNAALVQSGTGTRLITPSYGSPERPTVTVTPQSDLGYILVSVNNPASGSVSLGTTPYTFESGVTGFVSSPSASTTFTQSSSAAHTGSFSGLLTVVSAPGTQAYVRPPLSDSPTIVPGRRYTVSYWAYSPAGYALLGDAIDWYDASGVYLSTSSGGNIAISASTWTARAYTATAPASAAKLVYGPTLGGTPASGTKLYIDELLIADANDRPPVTVNQIMRKESTQGDDEYVIIGEIAEDGTYKDYAVASGVTYSYIARGQA